MQELRYLKTDGDFAVLESEDGTTFRVLLDDLQQKSAKPPVQSSNTQISPREIQLEIRAGMGIEEIASKTGASVAYIQKFAAPVIDELAHIVQSALSTRITVAGDRYSETVQVEFGEVIASRLAANGFSNPAWSSRKVDNSAWQITCEVDGEVAVWSFDLKKLALSPENELAVKLSTQQTLTDGPIPKLRSVVNTESPASALAASGPVRTTPPSAFTAAPVEVETEQAEGSLETEEPKSNITRDLGSTLEFEGVIPFGRAKVNSEPAEPTMGEDLANTADLLDALRKRRKEREEAEVVEHPFLPAEATTSAPPVAKLEIPSADDSPTQAIEVVTEAEAPQISPVELAGEDSGLENTQPLPPKKGRTSVPKWDEIVFGGPKSDED